MPDLTSVWGMNLEAAVCEHCDWAYLLPQSALSLGCPHCFRTPLTPLVEQVGNLPYNRSPELIVPFTVSAERLTQSILHFGSGIPFAPDDLDPQNLTERLQPVYLPGWLVDADVQAVWQAEAGFNYQLVSHQDEFDENKRGWASQQITKTRIRWEPRLGRLTRTYHNIAAPALEEASELKWKLGEYELETAQPYRPEALADAIVRLPNRLPSDAWPEAIPTVQTTAADECRQAASADHLRQFCWKAEYHNLNWTLLLLPLYVTYYLDDDGNPQPVLIHGQSGRLSGHRRASMKRAQRMALIIAVVAAVVFVLSLVMAIASSFWSALSVVGGIGLMVATIIGLLAIAPIVIVWRFNRSRNDRRPPTADR